MGREEDYRILANQCIMRLKEITSVGLAVDPFNANEQVFLQFDEKLPVRFSFDESKGRLYWFIYIGYLPKGIAESNDVCKILLMANGLAQTLTDCNFTLEPDEFRKSLITLVGGINLKREDPDDFICKLELFLQVAEHWKAAFLEESLTTLDASTAKSASEKMETLFMKI